MSINGIKISESAKNAINILNENGFEAYIVGGAVRDALTGVTPYDYDVATSATPEEVVSVFGEKNVIKTGIKHGTVTALTPMPIEITTFRKDGEYSDRRRPERVEFIGDINTDLKRRDFTVNAIAYSLKGGIIDLYGGLEDIKAKTIRAVGNPYERFDEDALRILRALRFSSTLGFKIEEKTAEALRALKENLKAVSKERVFTELTKLLKGKFVTEVLLEYAEVFFVIIPELAPSYKFDQHSKWHKYDVYEHIARSVGYIRADEVLRYTMLLHDAGKPEKFTVGENGAGHFYGHAEVSAEIAKRVLKRLKAPNKLINSVYLRVLRHDLRIKNDEISVKRKLNEYGEELFFDLMEIRRADGKAQGTVIATEETEKMLEIEKVAREIVSRADCYKLSDLKINGKDLENMGFHGERVGDALNFVLDAVINGDIQNDRERLLNFAVKRLKK